MGKRIAVIGSGPAGLSACAALREKGHNALLLERKDLLSLKLLASGGGRCNFSNILSMDRFMESFGQNGTFMRNALQFSFREWLISFLEKQGVRSVLTDDFFYFPASGKAKDVQRAFLDYACPEIRCGCEVREILLDEGKKVRGLLLPDGEEIPCCAVILAGGGRAWKGLGTGSGLALAEKVSHTIRQALPAVAPLLVEDAWVKSLAGVTLPAGSLTLKIRRRTLVKEGSILFTHRGLSGFPSLDLAGDAAELCAKQGKAVLYLNFNTALDQSAWEKVLQQGRVQEGNVFVKNLLGRYLTKSAASAVCELCHCEATALCHLTRESMRMLPEMLTKCPLTLLGAGPMEEAMVMRGGVSLKEVDPGTMESRLVKGLYFAGEILDLDGPCGGYNIQWAFSSGRLAGISCGEAFSSERG